MTAVEKFSTGVVEDFRQLARVVLIDEIVKHPNADRMELAIIGGWQCCVTKGQFQAGDRALFCEIDSLVPTTRPEFAFLLSRPENLVTVNTIVYSRVRTMRFRGELSQGLAVPIPKEFEELVKTETNLTTNMGVLKYERVRQLETPLEDMTWFERLCRKISGPPIIDTLQDFPGFIPKTEQQRVQNIGANYKLAHESGEEFEVSFKLDGDSTTYYLRNPYGNASPYDVPHVGVCSRNNEISLEEIKWEWPEQARRWFALFLLRNRRILKSKRVIIPKWKTGYLPENNHQVRGLAESGLAERLVHVWDQFGVELAVQGELCGPGIQGNKEHLKSVQFFVYRIVVLRDNSGKHKVGPCLPEQARLWAKVLRVPYTPIWSERFQLPGTIKECLEHADGGGAFGTEKREGLVFKSHSRDFSFKVLSNEALEAE